MGGRAPLLLGGQHAGPRVDGIAVGGAQLGAHDVLPGFQRGDLFESSEHVEMHDGLVGLVHSCGENVGGHVPGGLSNEAEPAGPVLGAVASQAEREVGDHQRRYERAERHVRGVSMAVGSMLERFIRSWRRSSGCTNGDARSAWDW